MKFEDLVWKEVEGKSYLIAETTLNLDGVDLLLEIIKYDDDSFKLSVNKINVETDLILLNEILVNDTIAAQYFGTYNEEIIESVDDTIKKESLRYVMGYNSWVNGWKFSAEHNAEYLEVNHPARNGLLALIKQDEDSFLIKVISDEYPNASFDETDLNGALFNYALTIPNIIRPSGFVEWCVKNKLKNNVKSFQLLENVYTNSTEITEGSSEEFNVPQYIIRELPSPLKKYVKTIDSIKITHNFINDETTESPIDGLFYAEDLSKNFFLEMLDKILNLKETTKISCPGFGLGASSFDVFLQSNNIDKKFEFYAIESNKVFLDYFNENLKSFWTEDFNLIEESPLTHDYSKYDIVYSNSLLIKESDLDEYFANLIKTTKPNTIIIEKFVKNSSYFTDTNLTTHLYIEDIPYFICKRN